MAERPRPLDRDALHGSIVDPMSASMNFLNEIANLYPDAISFAAGRPYEGFFDTADIERYLHSYVAYLKQEKGYSAEQVRRTLFQYGRTNGLIHELVARMLLADENIRVSPEAIVTTVGCQEAMLITLRALHATERDVLLVPFPCYVGVVGAARLLGIGIVPVEEGPGGLDPQAVCEAARSARAQGRTPRALYVVPDFSNPSGRSLDQTERCALLAVAEQEDLLILEDNPYGLFSDTDSPRPVLKSMDTAQRVIYLGSFAKSAFPGARVGYIVADQEVADSGGRCTVLADELSMIKSMLTVNTPTISQALIGGLLVENDCSLRAANLGRIEFHRASLRTLLRSLDHHFPPAVRSPWGVRWNAPAGGYFVVLEVPFQVDEEILTMSAQQYGVLWTPMSLFYLGKGGERAIRLSCSALAHEEIELGIGRLRRLVEERMP